MKTYKYSVKQKLLYFSGGIFFSFITAVNAILNPATTPLIALIIIGGLALICFFQLYNSFITVIITDAKIYKTMPFGGVKEIWLNEIYDCETSKLLGNLLLTNAYGHIILSIDKRVPQYNGIYNYIKELTVFNKQPRKFSVYKYQTANHIAAIILLLIICGVLSYLIEALFFFGILTGIFYALGTSRMFIKIPKEIVIEKNFIRLKYNNRTEVILKSEFKEIMESSDRGVTHYSLRLKSGRFIGLSNYAPELRYELQRMINKDPVDAAKALKKRRKNKIEDAALTVAESILQNLLRLF